jgi:hypothetical protein
MEDDKSMNESSNSEDINMPGGMDYYDILAKEEHEEKRKILYRRRKYQAMIFILSFSKFFIINLLDISVYDECMTSEDYFIIRMTFAFGYLLYG